MLGNMRRQGVQHLIAYCLNDSCRHQAVVDAFKYPDEVEVPWFQWHAGQLGRAPGLGEVLGEMRPL
jgi:hypothetical protein